MSAENDGKTFSSDAFSANCVLTMLLQMGTFINGQLYLMYDDFYAKNGTIILRLVSMEGLLIYDFMFERA